MQRRAIFLIIFFFLLYLSNLFFPFQSIEGRSFVYTTKITYISSSSEAQSLDYNLRAFNIFMNTSWQTAYLLSTSDSYTLSSDSDENKIIVFDQSLLPSNGNVTFSYEMMLEERKRSSPDINFALGGNLSDISETLKRQYCISNGSWFVDDTLRSLADSIWNSVGKSSNVLRIVTSFANWIGNNIKDVSHDVPFYPSETYLSREGDCDDQANMLIALCHIMGIPAYLQVGSLKWSSQNEVYWKF